MQQPILWSPIKKIHHIQLCGSASDLLQPQVLALISHFPNHFCSSKNCWLLFGWPLFGWPPLNAKLKRSTAISLLWLDANPLQLFLLAAVKFNPPGLSTFPHHSFECTWFHGPYCTFDQCSWMWIQWSLLLTTFLVNTFECKSYGPYHTFFILLNWMWILWALPQIDDMGPNIFFKSSFLLRHEDSWFTHDSHHEYLFREKCQKVIRGV